MFCFQILEFIHCSVVCSFSCAVVTGQGIFCWQGAVQVRAVDLGNGGIEFPEGQLEVARHDE